MFRSAIVFLHRVVRSHFAHVLLAVSWTFVLLVYAPPRRQPRFVDCTPIGDELYSYNVIVDGVYPIWTSVIVVAHLPAIVMTIGSPKLLQRIFALSCGPTANVEVPLLFVFSTIQWLLVGYTIESLFCRVRSRS